MTSPALNNREEPMSDFGAMLFETFRACEGRSCIVLAEVLRVKVRAWADEQSNLNHLTIDHGKAVPFGVADEGRPI